MAISVTFAHTNTHQNCGLIGQLERNKPYKIDTTVPNSIQARSRVQESQHETTMLRSDDQANLQVWPHHDQALFQISGLIFLVTFDDCNGQNDCNRNFSWCNTNQNNRYQPINTKTQLAVPYRNVVYVCEDSAETLVFRLAQFSISSLAMACLACCTVSAQELSEQWQKNETIKIEKDILDADLNVIKPVQHFEEDFQVFSTIEPDIPDNDFVPELTPQTPYENVAPPSPPEFSAKSNDFVGIQVPGEIQINNSTPQTVYPNDQQHSTDLLWWNTRIDQPLSIGENAETATTNELLKMSLLMSPRIQAISQDPLIREAQIIEADAEFDPALFARNLFEDRTDPVGNTLTTGGAEFLEDHIFSTDAGFRRKLRNGTEVEVSQRIGFQNSNSQFFVPQDQGTATLAINVSMPLLRGSGKYYNRLQILIAQSAGEVAWEVFSSELQDELQRVLSAYWQLYFDRSNYLQKKRNVARGEKILNMLENRSELDSLPSQITRARSSVEARKTDLANALRDVKNAESNIRRLVGEENWLAKQVIEILPIERPEVNDFNIPLKRVVETALQNRPEIREAANRAKIAAYQMDISQNEILPDFTMLLGTYASGLEGGSGVERAFVEQFSSTTPGYSMGFEFEIPYKNRAALSRFQQSRLQRVKLQHELRENVQRIVAESQIAYRRIQSALQTLKAAYVSIDAAHQDLRQQEQRFQNFAIIEGDLGDGQNPTTILDQLLDSQERLTAAENVYAQSILELQVASIALNRATGTLLLHEKVCFDRTCDGDSPAIQLYQSSSGPSAFDQPESFNR